jgi:phospholipid/cholesterol/gamma-HCH transport system substrate-binding protein
MPRSQHWKAGLFVISGAIILVAAIAMLAGIRLTAPRSHYTIRFSESVSGLEPGAAVRYRGVLVGKVDDIRIPVGDVSAVEVAVSIEREMPIKRDTKATLGTVVITGIKYVELLGGTPSSPPPARQSHRLEVFSSPRLGHGGDGGEAEYPARQRSTSPTPSRST